MRNDCGTASTILSIGSAFGSIMSGPDRKVLVVFDVLRDDLIVHGPDVLYAPRSAVGIALAMQ